VKEFIGFYQSGFAVGFISVAAIYLTIGAGFAALYWIVASLARMDHRGTGALIVFALSVIGGIAGYIGGASREPAVGEIVPAALSLIAGLAAFVVAKDSPYRIAVTTSAVCFALVLFLGYAYGANVRTINMETSRKAEINFKMTDACINILFNPASYTVNSTLPERLENPNDPILLSCLPFLNK
jgi:hypothetical protein